MGASVEATAGRVKDPVCGNPKPYGMGASRSNAECAVDHWHCAPCGKRCGPGECSSRRSDANNPNAETPAKISCASHLLRGNLLCQGLLQRRSTGQPPTSHIQQVLNTPREGCGPEGRPQLAGDLHPLEAPSATLRRSSRLNFRHCMCRGWSRHLAAALYAGCWEPGGM